MKPPTSPTPTPDWCEQGHLFVEHTVQHTWRPGAPDLCVELKHPGASCWPAKADTMQGKGERVRSVVCEAIYMYIYSPHICARGQAGRPAGRQAGGRAVVCAGRHATLRSGEHDPTHDSSPASRKLAGGGDRTRHVTRAHQSRTHRVPSAAATTTPNTGRGSLAPCIGHGQDLTRPLTGH